jgi:hypothetical protein
MNINSAFPSKYLKAADAEDSDLMLTIAKVKVETVGQGPKAEQKPIVYFKEVDKGLCLNKTNAKMIAKIAKSEDTDDWTGVTVRVVATEVEFQGDLVMSLRVREVKKAKPSSDDTTPEAPEAPPLDDRDIPFAWLLPLLVPALGVLATWT